MTIEHVAPVRSDSMGDARLRHLGELLRWCARRLRGGVAQGVPLEEMTFDELADVASTEISAPVDVADLVLACALVHGTDER